MCWACEKDEAVALLADGERVLAEAETLRQHGTRIIAQAYGDQYRAEQRREEDSNICKEVTDE
jgi:hypothetical protein